MDDLKWIAPTISAFVAGLGLILNFLSSRRQADATSVATFNTVRTRIQELALKIWDYEGKSKEKLRTWEEVFFNEIEWFCLLFERGDVPKGVALDHFKSSLLDWYGLFESAASEETKADPHLYRRFKAVVKRFREGDGDRTGTKLKARFGPINLSANLGSSEDGHRRPVYLEVSTDNSEKKK